MAVQAGTIETRLQADVSQFTSSMRSAETAFKRTASTISGGSASAASGLRGIQNAVNGVQDSLGRMQRLAQRSLAAIGGGFIISSIFQKASNAIIGFNQQLDSATIAMKSFTGSQAAADDLLATLQEFAARTPFNFQDLLSTSQQMLAMGVAADELLPRLTAIGDAAAAMGGSPEVMHRIQRALGQIQAKGRVQAEELMQLAEVGIPAYQYMADAIGVTIPEALNKMKKGEIDAATAVTGLLDGLTRDFGGMMEEQSKTMMGALSTVQDYVTMTVASMGRPLFEAIRDTMLKIANFLSSPKVVKAAEDFAKNFADFVKGIGGGVKQFLGVVGPSLVKIAKGAYEFSRALVNGLKSIAPLITVVGGAFAAMTIAVGSIVGALSPLLALLADNREILAVLAAAYVLATAKSVLFRKANGDVAAGIGTQLVDSIKKGVENFRYMKEQIASANATFASSGKQMSVFGAVTRAAMTSAGAAVKSFLASALPLLAISVALEAVFSWMNKNREATERAEQQYESLADSLKSATDALLENQDALKGGATGVNTLNDALFKGNDAAERLVSAFGALGMAASVGTIASLQDNFAGTAKEIFRSKLAAVGLNSVAIEAISNTVSWNEELASSAEALLSGVKEKGGVGQFFSDLIDPLKDVVGIGNDLSKQEDAFARWQATLSSLTGDQAEAVTNTLRGIVALNSAIDDINLARLAEEQAQYMIGAGQITKEMLAEAQAMTDAQVAADKLGPAAAAVALNQNLLKLATDAARIALVGQEVQLASWLGRATNVYQILQALKNSSEDGAVAFEDFAAAVYGAKYATMSWKRALAGAMGDFGSLINSLADATGNADALELAVFDLSDQMLAMIQTAAELGVSQDETSGTLAVMAKNFLDAGTKAGFTRDQIMSLIRQLGILDQIDPRISIAMDMDTSAIKAKIDSITKALQVALQRSPEAAAELKKSLAFWQSMQSAFGKVPTYSGGGGGGGGSAKSEIEQWVSSLVEYANGLISKDFGNALATMTGPDIMAQFQAILDDAVALGLDKVKVVMNALNKLKPKFVKLASLADQRDQLLGLIENAKYTLQDLRNAYEDLRHEVGYFDSTIAGAIAPKETSLDKARQAFEQYQYLLDERRRIIDEARGYKMNVAQSMMAPLSSGSLVGGAENYLRKAQEFYNSIQMLRGRGFPPSIIGEVISAGVIEGSRLAKKLLSLSAGDMNQLIAIRQQISTLAMDTGAVAADIMFGGDLAKIDGMINEQHGVVKTLYQQALLDAKSAIAQQETLVRSLESVLNTTNVQIARLVSSIQVDLYNTMFGFLAGFSGALDMLNKPMDWTAIMAAISYGTTSTGTGTVIVNVSGSVMTERDMIEAIRLGLLQAQASGKQLVLA